MNDAAARMLAGVRRAKSDYQPKRDETYRLGFTVHPEMLAVVERAAEARGISKTAFCQRAIVAMACATLGLDYYQFMDDIKAPPARSFHPVEKETRTGRKRERRITIPETSRGRGAGAWRIRGLD